jgi:hypothetical protein
MRTCFLEPAERNLTAASNDAVRISSTRKGQTNELRLVGNSEPHEQNFTGGKGEYEHA